ncbi:MAG: EpsI family protein [Planctomycetes bacterium]|nr:EpsI family protein [Planctomycetota bacterium]
MKTVCGRLWIVAAALVPLAALNVLLQCGEARSYGGVHARSMPMVIGEWSGQEVALDRETIEILETDDVLLRSYVKDREEPIWLCIVFSENNRKVAHPPEVCYAGAGWRAESKSEITLQTDEPGAPELNMARLLIANGNERQAVLYWYKAGERYTASYHVQQLNMMRDQLAMRKSSGALIRISMSVQGNDIEGAFSRLRQFAFAVLPQVSACLP